MPRLFISAAHKSSGKTTVTLGLAAALTGAGDRVQTFKKGPDYIDPMWLAMASGRSCYNLDFYTMSADEIPRLVQQKSADADITLIEGNKGLYDGLDLDGSNSNAALATRLETPVVLVLDARGMTRGIAPLVLGYQAFDKAVNIRGVILNQVGGARHESKLRAILEHYTDVKVLGAIHKHPDLVIDERHLGLVPSNENSLALDKIAAIARQVREQVDLPALREVAAGAPVLPSAKVPDPAPHNTGKPVRIGIAQDSAFGFYYQDDLETLTASGATLVPFNTLTDDCLPDVDGLFIGGGFPETHLAQLEANRSLRQDIREKIESGLPTYAECGGLMYLARSVSWNDSSAAMVGVIQGDIEMCDKPQGRGYVRLGTTDRHPWQQTESNPGDKVIQAHEFHYSRFKRLDQEYPYAYKVLRGTGIDGQHDGLILYNTLVNYSHLRSTGDCRWAQGFVDFIRRCQNRDQD